jgi:hypothetical protein
MSNGRPGRREKRDPKRWPVRREAQKPFKDIFFQALHSFSMPEVRARVLIF